MKSQIVICIPTNLSNRQEIAAALEKTVGTEYVFMGRVFQSTITPSSCEIDICGCQAKGFAPESSTSLADDFERAAQNRLDLVTRQQLDRCQQLVYLTSNQIGYDACLGMANLAQVILAIGGLAIKVESTGIAHSRQKWLSNYNSDDVFEIYSLYVQLVEGEDYYYSCGMNNFGKADVAMALESDIGLAIYVMNVFNYYRLTESPILQDGHTFQPDMGCPRYQMQWIEDREEAPASTLYNPYGRWYLTLELDSFNSGD
ncbi:MAG: hypothetical protein AAFO95_21450 [Cyanobacteria bacterium J06600_6]